DNKLTVSIFKESACSHCNNCSDSSKIVNTLTFLYDKSDIKIGDIISFEMEDNQLFKAAFIVYIIPLFFMFGGYFLGNNLGLEEGLNIVISFLSLIISFLGIFFYDKIIVKEKLEKSIKIIEIQKRTGDE
ncbi:MAG: SoxR reducing system RseC family protein, partial [Cetobacterium sp.]